MHPEIQPGQPDGQREQADPDQHRDPGAGLLIDGSSTTSTTPRMAADASAWPDGNDSLVSVTSRYSTGGRSRPTVALPNLTSSPAPAATTATSDGVTPSALDQQVDDGRGRR